MLGNLKAANDNWVKKLARTAISHINEHYAEREENARERVIDPETRAAGVFEYQRTVDFNGHKALFYGESFDDINALVKRASLRYYGPITSQGDTIPSTRKAGEQPKIGDVQKFIADPENF